MASPFILSPEDFEHGAIDQSEMRFRVESLTIKGEHVTSVNELTATYNAHAELYLECSTENRDFEMVVGGETIAQGGDLPEPVKLIPVSQDAVSIRFVPRFQPFTLSWTGHATTARAIVINAPDLQYCAEPLLCAHEGFELSLAPTKAARDFYREKSLHKYDAIATAILTVKRTDGAAFDHEEAAAQVHRLNTFLTFVRGGGCAVGHFRGVDADGALAFASLGFNAHDPLEMERGWSADMVIRSTPHAFELYNTASSNPVTGAVIRRAIDYYRASNVARASSKEVALVASYAGLEALIPHILTNQAGWTNSALQTQFAAKLRAAAQHIGLGTDLFEHAIELSKRVTPSSDAWDILALFRNRVTHYKQSFSCSGIELHEAWQASQWLCEILVLHLIGYRGQMNDRRRYTGWKGPSVDVPLPKLP